MSDDLEVRFRDIENRTSKSSDMNYSSPTIGVRFNRPSGRGADVFLDG